MSVRGGRNSLNLKNPSKAKLRRIGAMGNATQSMLARERTFDDGIPF